MNCVLTVTQAYEVFFSLFLRVELVFKPLATESRFRLRDVNQLLEDLRKNTKKYTFDDLRALVLSHRVSGCSPNDLAAAKSLVARLSTKPKTPNKLTINKLSDPKLKRLLNSLKGANVNTLRNRVVHKNAYRPSRQEAEAALQEARDILFPLQKYFQIRNDLDWYRTSS